jgi:hypothetical protein
MTKAEVVEQDTGGKRKKAPKSNTKHMRWNMEEVTVLIGSYAKYSEIPKHWATINQELNRQLQTCQ